jgi:hypothetical protein
MNPTIGRCRSCNAEIIWCRTAKGKAMPLDAKPTYEHAPGLFGLDMIGMLAQARAPREGEPRYRSHFATCEFASQHRHKR